MISKVIDYFKDAENFSILLFLLYVIILTQIVQAFVLSMCWISSAA
jgi:hypothetical protein